jgi:hypothetical protein
LEGSAQKDLKAQTIIEPASDDHGEAHSYRAIINNSYRRQGLVLGGLNESFHHGFDSDLT